jgi:hypothetical protein
MKCPKYHLHHPGIEVVLAFGKTIFDKCIFLLSSPDQLYIAKVTSINTYDDELPLIKH